MITVINTKHRIDRMTIAQIAYDFHSDTMEFPCSPRLDSQKARWLALSAGQIEAAWRETKNHWSAKHGGWLTIGGALLGAALLSPLAQPPSASNISPEFLGQVLVYMLKWPFFCMLGGVSVYLVLWAMNRQNSKLQATLLSPAETSHRCAEALKAVEDSERARAYRDDLVARGRDLRVLDLEHMISEAIRDSARRKELEKERVLRDLKGPTQRPEAEIQKEHRQ